MKNLFIVFAILTAILTASDSRAQSTSWSLPVDITMPGQDSNNPKVAVSAPGTTAIAVWIRSNGTHNIVQAATAEISGSIISWSPPIDLSQAGQSASEPAVALSSDGTQAIAIWTRGTVIQSATASISGNLATWSSETDLTASGPFVSEPQIAISSDGTKASALWFRLEGIKTIVQSRSATITSNSAS